MRVAGEGRLNRASVTALGVDAFKIDDRARKSWEAISRDVIRGVS